MPDSNLARVAEWLAEEERKKKEAEAAPDSALTREYYAATVRPYDTGPLHAVRKAVGVDPEYAVDTVRLAPGMKSEARTTMGWDGQAPLLQGLREGGAKLVPPAVFEGMQEQAALLSPGGAQPKGALPFISGVPTHPATKPAFAYIPPTGDVGMAEAMSGAAGLARSGAPAAAPPPAKPSPRATLAKARNRTVDVHSTKDGVQPAPRVPVDPLAARGAAPLPSRVSTFLQGRRPSGLEDAQRRANVNQLSANLAQSAEFLGAGVGGVRPRPGAFSNLQEQAGQPVEQYQQRAAEEHQQEQEERALAEAQREAERAERDFTFKQGRATSEDQLARDRMAQEERLAGKRMEGDAADRALRRSEFSYRKKEGEEFKKEMAREKQKARETRDDELDSQRLGAATAKAPFGEFQTQLEEIDRLVPGLPYGVVPNEEPLGMRDRAASALSGVGGDFFMTDEGRAYSTAISNLRDLISRMRSGAVLNEGEERHYRSLLGDHVFSDKRAAAKGIDAVRQGIAQKLRNAQGGYQNVLDRFEGTGATTYRAPIFGAAPTGEEIEMPDGSVHEVLADGTTRRRP